MALAGNTTGAGGAKSLAKVERGRRRRAAPPPRPKPAPPPSFPRYVPSKPGAVASPRRARPTAPAPRVKTSKPATAPNFPRFVPQRPGETPAQRATSVRKRTKRVELSAQRKRTGGEAPIIVRRRAKVARQTRALRDVARTGEKLGVLVAPKHEAPPQRKRPGGILGTTIAAAEIADKVLSGKTTAKAVSGAANVVGKAVAGDYTRSLADRAYATVLGHKPKPIKSTFVTRLARGVGHDIVDVPANVIPSVYVPGKGFVKGQAQTVTGHPGRGAKTIYREAVKPVYEGAKETVTHPLEHPLATALTFSGVEGALGRGAGAAARTGALGRTVKRAGRTERASRTVPGTRARVERPYSPDIVRKGGQVIGEKIAARRAVKKGESPKRMAKGEIHRDVDQFVRVTRNVRGRAEEHVVREVHKAVGGRRKARRASAAHTVAVQGLTNATKADLQRLLKETKAVEGRLSGDALRENRQRQTQIEDAIERHKGPATERAIRATQQAYRDIDRRQEGEMVDLGILEQGKADVARYTPAAVRHGLHDPEAAPVHVAMAKDLRKGAEKEKARAHRAKLKANADLRETVQRTRAAELGPRGKRSRGLDKAKAEHKAARKNLDDTRARLDKDVRDAEVELTVAHHDAVLSQTKVSKTPEVLRHETELREATTHLAALQRRAAGRERPSGRLEGRAQEQVKQADKGRAVPPHEIGTRPRALLAQVERRGGEDLALRTEIARASERVEQARIKLAKTRSRFQGVPPAKADRLRNALVNRAQARLRKRQGHGLEDVQDAVLHAEARVAHEKSKLGLEPAAADRLWKAIGESEAATSRHKQAIVDEHLAITRHRALKAASFIDRQGRPATVEDVAAHPAMAGQPEPSFLPHAYERQRSALPVKRVNIANPQGRSGALVAEGRSPVAGAHLTNARIDRQRLIETARARNQFLEHFGFRENGDRSADLARYGTEGSAVQRAGDAERITGTHMAPLQNQDGTWSLVPRDARARLEEHERTAGRSGDLLQTLGRQWRQGVLAFSFKWLAGQYGEGVLRTAVEQAFNPVKLARSHRLVSRTLDELRQIDPDAAARFESTYKRGGAGRLGEQARQEAFHDFQMGESGGRLMQAMRQFARRKTPRAVGDLYGAWQHFMFNWMNGGMETAVRRGMVGRALIEHPIFRDKGIVVNFSKAAEELAQGLTDTATQNRLVDQVDDAYGKYQGQSPQAREVIENVTPFIPWFISAMKFLSVVLPRDHPVLTGLLAASNVTTEDWRRKHGLVFGVGDPIRGDEDTLPLWEQGSVPSGSGVLNVSHYGPFGAVQSFADLGSFIFPQYSDIQAAAKGEDWRGYPLTGRSDPPSLRRVMTALASAGVTSILPPLGTAAHVAGVRLPHEAPPVAGEKTTLAQRAVRQINPLPKKEGIATPGTGTTIKPVKVKPIKVKPIKVKPIKVK